MGPMHPELMLRLAQARLDELRAEASQVRLAKEVAPGPKEKGRRIACRLAERYSKLVAQGTTTEQGGRSSLGSHRLDVRSEHVWIRSC
ncbi:MAG: hypothetical protein XD60_0562 [Acetothermia bacterium 64_32]|nr:MAG: hypothetical protein XD60_0562 [Acetothermia bacterium 64_32]HAF71190.1 hypothetical protein [Candidatus Acetothermia bacterium]